MRKHLQRELDHLNRLVSEMAAIVERNVTDATNALVQSDAALARQVSGQDREVDKREVHIEEEALKIIALHQPVADDLRHLVAVLKADHDLERISDLAVNIAVTADEALPQIVEPYEDALKDLMGKAGAMVRDSVDALLARDEELASSVWSRDEAVDAASRQLHERLCDELPLRADRLPTLIGLLAVGRHIERMADHAASIAKDVIYLCEGRIVRHRGKEFQDNHSA